MNLFAELKRRNVTRIAGLYLVGAWLMVQVAGTLLPMFEAPLWVARAMVLLLAIGFLPALVIAWMFERTPHGLKRDADVVPELAQAPLRARRMDRTLVVVLALALAYFAVDRFLPGSDPVADASTSAKTAAAVSESDSDAVSAKSIAVLPFADLSPAHDQEYFSDGIAEELLNALAKVKDLKVAARTASFRYRGGNESLKTIGEALGVNHILEGSVRKQGDKVRITAQLIQTADGFHRWSETYDGDMSDVFELQERIARAITLELKAILEGEQQHRLVPVATTSAEAYALFLEATANYNRREDYAGSITSLEQALRLDPNFARAQARLAAVHVVYTDLAAHLQLAETHAREAIARDATLAEPWAVLARSFGEQRRFLEAREAYARALTLEPDDALTNYWYAVALITTGHTREGRARLDRALVLDPEQPNAELWRGLELSYVGDQEAAQRSVQHAADMGLSFAFYGLSEVAYARGDAAQAYELMLARYARRMAECGIRLDAAKRALSGMLGSDPKARADARAIIEVCLAKQPEPTPFWAVKGLFYLDQPARLLEVSQARLTSNETFLFQMLWSPYGKSARRLPAFAEFARKTGLAAVWDKYGPPDACRKSEAGEYVCK